MGANNTKSEPELHNDTCLFKLPFDFYDEDATSKRTEFEKNRDGKFVKNRDLMEVVMCKCLSELSESSFLYRHLKKELEQYLLDNNQKLPKLLPQHMALEERLKSVQIEVRRSKNPSNKNEVWCLVIEKGSLESLLKNIKEDFAKETKKNEELKEKSGWFVVTSQRKCSQDSSEQDVSEKIEEDRSSQVSIENSLKKSDWDVIEACETKGKVESHTSTWMIVEGEVKEQEEKERKGNEEEKEEQIQTESGAEEKEENEDHEQREKKLEEKKEKGNENFDDMLKREINGMKKSDNKKAEKRKEKKKDESAKIFSAHLKELRDKKDEKLEEKLEQLQAKVDENAAKSKERVEQRRKEDEEFEKEMEEILKKNEQEREKEHKKLLENQKEKFEERRRQLREERESYEKETEERRCEYLEELNKQYMIFWECVRRKQEFEMKEDEWSNWLNLLRESIISAKWRFMKFEEIVEFNKLDDEFERDDIQVELGKLRQDVLISYDLFYDSYFKMKTLSEALPQRIFLLVLQNRFSKVCNHLHSVVAAIDNIQVDENMSLLLRDLFGEMDPSHVPSTGSLRKEERSSDVEKLRQVKDPVKYNPPQTTKVEEIPEDESADDYQNGRKNQVETSEDHKIEAEAQEHSYSEEQHGDLSHEESQNF